MPRPLFHRLKASLNYRCSKAASEYWHRRFRRATPADYLPPSSPPFLHGIQVFSLCGKRQIYEQLLSMLSFLHYAGMPEKWIVVSDGTLSDKDRDLLKTLNSAVEFAEWTDFINDKNRRCVEPYSRANPMGKKLALMTSLPSLPISLYIDTDVLFFPGASELQELDLTTSRFLLDNSNGTVSSLLTPEEQKLPPVNGGFLIQATAISWAEPLDRLQILIEKEPDVVSDPKRGHLLEQTLLHLAYNASGAQPLDSSRYVLKLDDAYDWQDRYVGKDIVLRHYVINTRMKFWRHARHFLK